MEADKVHVLVERIYDTVLDTHAWPDVLQDIAYATGASGTMVFELTQSATGGQIACPHLSANYDRDAVLAYLANHNDQEIIDQAHFAKVSGQDPKITLINDSAFPVTPDELRAQANVQDMLSFGLCHRSGTLLNKDTWQIDRFSLQYRKGRDAADATERAIAELLLPHVAKALRIGRPINAQHALDTAFPGSDFGLCLLSPQGDIIAQNPEFERVLSEMAVFTKRSTGKLALWAPDDGRFQALLSDRHIHGAAGSRPRKQSLFFPTENGDGGVFVEICPANDHPKLGKMPAETRLITVLDSNTSRKLNVDVVSRFFPLSDAEKDILAMIGAGLSNREISDRRGRAINTIDSQVKALFCKTHTRNRTELVQLSLSLAAPFSDTGA